MAGPELLEDDDSPAGGAGGGFNISSSCKCEPDALACSLDSAGTLASRGCVPLLIPPRPNVSVRVFVLGIRQVDGSLVCSECPRGRGLTVPFTVLIHPGHVHLGSHSASANSQSLHCPSILL